jgi:hypothetical protein
LFTLDKRNAKNPSIVLTKLINFAQDGGGPAAVLRTGSGSQAAPKFVPFGNMVDRAFNSARNKPAIPAGESQGDRGI